MEENVPRLKMPIKSRVLLEEVRARHDSKITECLNILFSNPEVTREQVRVADEWDAVGTAWSDERW